MSISSDAILDELLSARVLEPPSHPGPLARLGRYAIVRHIGSGGMGIIFLARDETTSARVALKLLRPTLVKKEWAVHRFLVEARHMQNLSHPHILPVLEVCDRAHGPFFSIPFMAGGSLADHLKRCEPQPIDRALRLIDQIGNALAYAHDHGIVHRDVKPGNILLDEQGTAYLTDFGLGLNFAVNDSLIQDQCAGTAPYMAPEVAAGKPGDARSDIYCLGATLYEILAGRPPYDGRTAEEIQGRIIDGPPPPLKTHRPDLSSGVIQLVSKAMGRELRDRYADMGDLLSDLAALTRATPPRGAGRWRPSWRYLVPGIAVLLLMSIGLMVSFNWTTEPSALPPGPPPDPPYRTAQAGKLLFSDDFAEETLDLTRWRWGQKDFSYQGLVSGNHAQLSQGNWSLLLAVRAQSTGGWTAMRTIWLEPRHVLDIQHDQNIGIRISVDIGLGLATLVLSDGAEPAAYDDPHPLRLYELNGGHMHPLRLENVELNLFLHATSRSVLLPKRIGDKASYRSIDISDAMTQLRFQLGAHTSSGLPPGRASCRLHSFTITQVERWTGIHGQVFDLATNKGIPGALVALESGRSCESSATGVFLLPIEPVVPQVLRVRARDYQPASPLPTAYAELGEQTELRIPMRRTPAEPGSAVQSLVPSHSPIQALEFDKDAIYFVAGQGPTPRLYRMTREGNGEQEICPVPPANGIVRIGDLLYFTTQWPGRMYSVTQQGTINLVRHLETDWPGDVAFDGTTLWHVDANRMKNQVQVCAVDPSTGQAVGNFTSSDTRIFGIASLGGKLWISSELGRLYLVDPARAMRSGRLDGGLERTLSGDYRALATFNDQLWGVARDSDRICRIRTDVNP